MTAIQICLSCGTQHGPAARFCSICGQPLEQPDHHTAPDRELDPGTLLGDRYEIRAVLGRGGFSVVYGAIDRRLQVPVAVKQNLDSDHDARIQFLHEAQILARLRHPNLVRVIDSFNDPLGQFLVMEYVRGKDLAQLMIAARGRLPVEQVVRWGIEVCGVLDYLHTQEPPVIHRDIKPANLKLNPNGEIIVIDLGIAKVQRQGQATMRAAQAYTSGYSPLEQYLMQGTNPRSDLYALGATLYHLLSGTPPPPAPDRMAGVELEQLIHRRADVPPLIADALAAALEVQAADRPASAAVLRDLLEHALQATLASPVDVIWPGPPHTPQQSQTLPPSADDRIERHPSGMIWPNDGKEMVPVAGGAFILGDDDGDNDEQPAHVVEVRPFLIDRFPVTTTEYARFVAATAHHPPEYWGGDQPPQGTEDLPVVGISLADALDYARWAGKRLPTEAEWEKAAAWDGTRAQRYPWGDDWDPLHCNSKDGGAGGVVAVGIYSPQGDSPYGAGDMAGNIWEWTSSLYRPYPYDPADGRENPEGGGLRVVRGGSWRSGEIVVRVANRNVSAPSNIDPEIGFRCVADMPE